ncbi:MAG: acyltransferase [Bacteroidaceae bacterium]|nr:acyltransferase [Bacteroidaceae bacterium]MDO4993687.1 acyltransferase [Bacteroidales bacterium]
MKTRNHTFDLLCGLCILRMILLHVAGICGMRSDFWCGKMMAWTFFFMSFFFFKAGYFNKTVAGDSWAYTKDRAKRLLVPYLTWGLIGTLIYAGLILTNTVRFAPYIRRLEWSHVWETSQWYGNPPLWFLLSFFTAYIVMHFMGKRPKVQWAVLAFPLIGYWLWTMDNPLWLSLNNVFMGVFFFWLGKAWRRITYAMTQPQHTGRRWILLALSLLMVAGFIWLNHHAHGEYEMSFNRFIQRPVSAVVVNVLCLCGLSGVLFCLPQRRVPFVNYVGEHSMVFFVAHYPVLHFYHMTHQLFGHGIRHHWDDFVLMTALTLVVCAWLVPYVEKIPILSGRWQRRT